MKIQKYDINSHCWESTKSDEGEFVKCEDLPEYIYDLIQENEWDIGALQMSLLKTKDINNL